MSLLELGSGDSVQDYYLPNGQVDPTKLNQHVVNFRQKFSNDRNLTNDVEKLMSSDEAFKNTTTQSKVVVNSTPDSLNQNTTVTTTFSQPQNNFVQSTPQTIPLLNTPEHDDYNPYMKQTNTTLDSQPTTY